jgi:cytochrome c oxidase cbb3-type subunit 2
VALVTARLFVLALLALPPARGGYTWTPGPESSGLPTRERPTDAASLRREGPRVYLQRCAPCHGKRGDGRGWVARGLVPAPRDFTSGVYKLRSTPTGSIPTDGDLFATISRGLHGTAMNPWRGLPEDERWALVDVLKSFSVRFRQEEPGQTVIVPRIPDDEAALVPEGRVLFTRLRCPSCHGDGEEAAASAALLRRDPGRKVRIRRLGDGVFLRGTSMRDLYVTLQTGLDGTPMGSYAEALTAKQTWAVAAYVRSLIPTPAP